MFDSIQSKARAHDGCAISYRVYPQPGKPRVVLIHSLALDSDIWREVITELGGDLEILTYDCRGHGSSERRAGDYTARLFAGDLAAVLDHAEWSSAVIAGCSMGGCVAQAFAAEFPNRAAALALIDTTVWYGPTAEQEWLARADKAATEGFAAMMPMQLPRWLSDAYIAQHPQEIEELTRVFLANDVACYRSSCALLGTVDLRNEVTSLRMPATVVIGADDIATPLSMAETIHELIAGSTLKVLPGARHLTPVECPAEIAAIIEDLAGQAMPATSF